MFQGRGFLEFSITLAFKSLASSNFQFFLVVFSIKGFLIRIVGCTRKGKWEGIDGMVCWECAYVGI